MTKQYRIIEDKLWETFHAEVLVPEQEGSWFFNFGYKPATWTKVRPFHGGHFSYQDARDDILFHEKEQLPKPSQTIIHPYP